VSACAKAHELLRVFDVRLFGIVSVDEAINIHQDFGGCWFSGKCVRHGASLSLATKVYTNLAD
jgi:hypothetical protein